MGNIRRNTIISKPLTVDENYDRLVLAYKKLYAKHEQLKLRLSIFSRFVQK